MVIETYVFSMSIIVWIYTLCEAFEVFEGGE
jgi:hypothetical protein